MDDAELDALVKRLGALSNRMDNDDEDTVLASVEAIVALRAELDAMKIKVAELSTIALAYAVAKFRAEAAERDLSVLRQQLECRVTNCLLAQDLGGELPCEGYRTLSERAEAAERELDALRSVAWSTDVGGGIENTK